MQDRMVRFLTLLTSLVRWALQLEVSRFQAIKAQLLLPYGGYTLLARQGLEFPAHVQGVLARLANCTGSTNARNVCLSGLSARFAEHGLP